MESAHHHLLQDHHLLVGSSTNLLFQQEVEERFRAEKMNSSNIQHASNRIEEDLGCHSWVNNQLYLETKSNLESSTKFSDLLTSGNLSRIEQKDEDLSEKLMLKTLLLQSPNSYHVESPFESMGSLKEHGPMFSANDVGASLMSSQIHPSVNIPSLSGFHGISSMEDVNLQPLDLFSMDRSNPQAYSRLQHSLGPQNLPSLNNNGPKRRTSSKFVEPKATPQPTSKRQRAESRSSCPPFKVRKEKLGDRIAALQQMVSPFGKTDTASVLMEAIGYIKFLQTQVQTLSVPYMKLSSRNKNTMQEEEEEEADLRSGGLCLVPLSCMNYIANDGGGGVGTWPLNPHNYNDTGF